MQTVFSQTNHPIFQYACTPTTITLLCATTETLTPIQANNLQLIQPATPGWHMEYSNSYSYATESLALTRAISFSLPRSLSWCRQQSGSFAIIFNKAIRMPREHDRRSSFGALVFPCIARRSAGRTCENGCCGRLGGMRHTRPWIVARAGTHT